MKYLAHDTYNNEVIEFYTLKEVYDWLMEASDSGDSLHYIEDARLFEIAQEIPFDVESECNLRVRFAGELFKPSTTETPATALPPAMPHESAKQYISRLTRLGFTV